MRLFFYLASIVLANVLTAKFEPIEIGMLFFPVGSILIGATFIFRDLVQSKYGRKKTYMFIGLALTLSAAVSFMLGDTMMVVAASAAAFIVSETFDTEIFTRMKSSFTKRVFVSGVVGGTLDSVIFVTLGLSPIGAGFLTWEVVPYAIGGQLIAKISMQAIGALILMQVLKMPKWQGALQ